MIGIDFSCTLKTLRPHRSGPFLQREPSMKQFIIIVTVFFFTSMGTAQHAPLSLDRLIDQALANSYRIQEKEANIDAAAMEFRFERSRALPRFSGELLREDRFLQPYRFRQQTALIQSDWALGDLLLGTSRAAERTVRAARAEKEQTRLEVIRRAVSLYLGILQKQADIDVSRQRLRLLQSHHEITSALWEAGTRTQLDVLQTEAGISRAEEGIVTLRTDLDNRMRELGRLIGWSSADTLQVSALDAAALCSLPVPECPDTCLQGNPLLRSYDFYIQARRLRITGVLAGQIPRMHVNGGYVQDGDPTGDGNYWQVSAGIQMPLFRWGGVKFEKEKLRAELQALEAGKHAAARGLTISIERTLADLRRLRDVLTMRRCRLEIEEKTFQIAEANYRSGLATNLEVLSAQQALHETRTAIKEVQLDYIAGLVDYYLTVNRVDLIRTLAPSEHPESDGPNS